MPDQKNSKKKRKRTDKKQPLSQYLDIEAESNTSAESFSDDRSSLSDYNDVPVRKNEWQTLISKIEKKYGDVEERSREDEAEEVVRREERVRPGPGSPKLWLVRVKSGRERGVLFRVQAEIEKAARPACTDRDGGGAADTSNRTIFSVVYKESLPGYIYIESFDKQAVMSVVEPVRFVRRNHLTVVPLEEMVDVLSFRERHVGIGTYVRIRRGVYRGEVGMVVEQVSDEIVRAKFVGRVEGRRRRLDVRKEGVRTGDGYKFRGMVYDRDGFLIRKLRLAEIAVNVTASVREMEPFSLGEGARILRGDSVEILRGELRSVCGVVKERDDDRVRIAVDNATYDVNIGDVRRKFNLGDKVYVKGEGNGIIVHLMDSVGVVSLNDFNREIKIALSELDVAREEYAVRIAPRKLRQRRDFLQGKKVTITNGEYKGYQGTVKDVVRNRCLVELVSNLERVEVNKDAVSLYNDEVFRSPGWRSPFRGLSPGKRSPYTDRGMKTPGYKTPSAVRTPGYKTPGYRTPSTARTPGYKTPSRETTRTGTAEESKLWQTPTHEKRYDPAYKTPCRVTPGRYDPSQFDGTHKTPSHFDEYDMDTENVEYADTSPYYNALLEIDGQTVEVNDIRFARDESGNCLQSSDDDVVVLKNGSTVGARQCVFVRPEQFSKVVVMAGKHKGHTGMLVRLMEQRGMLRSASLGAVEVDLDVLSRIAS